jgi:hypothetical protein
MEKKLKIVCAGDTHGRDKWKEIVAKELESSDRIIFMGDYFDTHYDETPEQQLSNFNEIVEFKKTNMEYYPEIPDFVEKYVGTWITDSYIWDDNYGSDEKPTTLTRVEKKEIVSYEWVSMLKI